MNRSDSSTRFCTEEMLSMPSTPPKTSVKNQHKSSNTHIKEDSFLHLLPFPNAAKKFFAPHRNQHPRLAIS